MKKLAAILMVFILLSIVGCIERDKTPPTILLSIDGKMGENGWYVSNVTISIEAYDNESTVKELKYRVDGEPWIWKDYRMPFKISKNGEHFIEYYAVDDNGNKNEGNITVKIDKNKPSIQFTNFEAGYIYFRGKKFITPRIPRDTMIIGDFTIEVKANDTLSGMQKVEFYLGETMLHEDREPPYEWKIEKAYGIYNVTAIAYDMAGNANMISIDGVQFINIR